MRRVVPAVVLALGLLAGCSAPAESPRGLFQFPQSDASNAGFGRVDTIKRVIDGDTVVLSDNVTVRILGIDTPETKKPRTPVQCWGPEATTYAKQQFPVGKKVRLDFEPGSTDKTRSDRYGRLLAYVMYQKSGSTQWSDFSVDTTRAGNARNYVYDKKPVSRQADIAKAEAEAKKARRGLWNPQNCRG